MTEKEILSLTAVQLGKKIKEKSLCLFAVSKIRSADFWSMFLLSEGSRCQVE